MAVLDPERYEKVILKGKQSVILLKENDLEGFIKFAEEGWALFPDPKDSWNQGYNYAKMVFKGLFEHKKLDLAKIWLERMADNNNCLKLYNYECEYYEGKYHFEMENYELAFEKFRYVVLNAGFRYFDSEDEKYLKFYKEKSIADKK